MIPDSVQTYCYAGAAWSMYANPAYTERASAVCDRAPDPTICHSTYNLAAH